MALEIYDNPSEPAPETLTIHIHLFFKPLVTVPPVPLNHSPSICCDPLHFIPGLACPYLQLPSKFSYVFLFVWPLVLKIVHFYPSFIILRRVRTILICFTAPQQLSSLFNLRLNATRVN